jgi:hypothetical protein
VSRTARPDPLAIDPLSGEFADRSTESAYLARHLPRTRAQLAFTLLLCSLYFLGFFATDLAALGLVPDTALLLGARVLVALTAGSCAWLAWRRPLGPGATRLAATVSEVVALGCFMLIAVHRPGEFHWHAMSLAIMLLVIYLYIPNRLAYALGIAALATGVFLVLTLALTGMDFADLLTMGMLMSLVNTVGALAAWRYNVVAREGVDSVVRYGGEEFLLVLPETDLQAAVRLAEWLRSRCAAAAVDTGPGGPSLSVTASFGVAATADGSVPVPVLIDAADKLLYAAKHNGRDRVEALALPAPGPVAAPLAA